MSEPAGAYHRHHHVTARLHALGLTEAVLREAVSRGMQARSSCTAFHPPVYRGFTLWAESHRALRELLVPAGWMPDDTGGFATAVSPDGLTAIAIMTGSDRTGKTGFPVPHTKHRRGALTHHAIRVNQLALQLFGPTPGEALDEEELRSRRTTWVLLVHVRHDEVALELSCPRDIDEGGKISSWTERILLTPLDTELRLDFLDGEDDDDDPGIEVDVTRR